MTQQTFIKGKDSALEDSISGMMDKLDNIGISVEQVSWLNPVPNVFSVHIKDVDCGLMFTNGKGATEKACLASALGEYFERLSCNYFFADFYLGEEISRSDFVHYPDECWIDRDDSNFRNSVLSDKLWSFYDPEQQLSAANLFEVNSGAGERGVCCLPYTRQSDQQSVLFPVNIIANCYVSNGMSAGNTQNEARVQALSEIFERYVKNKIIAEGLCLPDIPSEVIQRFPSIEESIRSLESHGYHLRVSDASLGGKYPVIAVTLINPGNATVFASFGAHPCFEVALERTVTELLQGRGLDQLDGFQSPSLDLDEVADPHNLETHFIDSSGLMSYEFFNKDPDFAFVDWDFDADTGKEYTTLENIIHQLDFDIYISDYQHLNVYSCRILVPGMSEIYPVDDLVWNNNNEGALLREIILSLPDQHKDELVKLYAFLSEQGYSDFQAVAEFIGIAPDPGSVWSELRIGELKAMICLAIDHHDSAEWVDWCLHLDQLSPDRHQLYHCLSVLLELDIQQQNKLEISLNQLFGKQRFEQCKKIIRGEITFAGLHSPGLSLQGFELHQKLLDGYLKLQAMKNNKASS
ncbi:MAG: 30s ribosomal protein S12 methylthiotransferase accessory protein YcaO [Gammaproteobacteria bacterium]|jgi:ribosomal protein S12 methylthiotransferase accessory factor|nr:30s ribosomal protein S12 methylthiotransferase accessory protein YcaO [Gammaproteobacteria bacterium]MBT3722883.1 30s ribosomal protein S12 methylthiotransferase accessory protein YcaO [Gammaproteobacteria bacterium]MBT6700026.1 30s ribosomal protein S12 methylthiotransferase accessory protein YcaO [Gammaproteobacteria bacterium]